MPHLVRARTSLPRLCGYPPFFEDDDQEALFTQIRTGAYEFTSPYWDCVSEDGELGPATWSTLAFRLSLRQMLCLNWCLYRLRLSGFWMDGLID
jgi:hypothetical protein